MTDFDGSLSRVLDPEGLYWCYPDDEFDDVDRVRTVEIRLDVPRANKEAAVAWMGKFGWLIARSDENGETAMVFLRREQSLSAVAKTEMLTAALETASRFEGRFWSWINVDEVKY